MNTHENTVTRTRMTGSVTINWHRLKVILDRGRVPDGKFSYL